MTLLRVPYARPLVPGISTDTISERADEALSELLSVTCARLPAFFFHLATRVVTAISMEMAVRAISGGVAGPFWPPQLLPGHLPSFGGEIRRRRRRPRHFGLRTCHEECVRSRGCRRVARGASTITSLGVVAEAQPQPRGSLSAFGRVFGQKRPHGKAALQSGFARARALAWWQCWTVSAVTNIIRIW